MIERFSEQRVPAQETVRESANAMAAAFAHACRSLIEQLPPGQVERFACVQELPNLFEQKIRAYAAMPENRGRDLASPETIAYLKSYLLNYNVRDSGPAFHALESVLRDYASTDSSFLRSAPGALVEAIARSVAAEKSLD